MGKCYRDVKMTGPGGELVRRYKANCRLVIYINVRRRIDDGVKLCTG